MVARKKVALNAAQAADFDKAFQSLSELVDFEEADRLCPARDNAVYTTSVILWMLVYQRMSPDSTLEAAVKRLIDYKPKLLRKNKRITNGTLSPDSGAYSKARSRIPQGMVRWFAEQVSKSLIDSTKPSFHGKRAFVLDGTTIILAPEAELQEAFPPASNQYGEGVWPVALLVVAHELASGAALIPEIGAMYGKNAISETALIRQSLAAMPPSSLVMADSGFGIFAVAHTIAAAGHTFVLRMTQQRFNSMRKKATQIDSGDNFTSYSLAWRPTAHERSKHPDLPRDCVLNVRLHEIVINDHLTLNLVTDGTASTQMFSDLYKHRGDIEIDIRNLKIVLDTENIRARSLDTFYKELYASIVSYNLVSQFRKQAAELIDEPPRRMSFTRTWRTYKIFLLSAMYRDAISWRKKYELALGYAMKDKLPNRPGRRFVREAYPKRPKSNQFKKRKRKSKNIDDKI